MAGTEKTERSERRCGGRAEARRARQAASLRDNLRRRKAQARARADRDEGENNDGAAESDSRR